MVSIFFHTVKNKWIIHVTIPGNYSKNYLNNVKPESDVHRSLAAIQAKVKRELDAEKKLAATELERQNEPIPEQPEPKEFEASPMLAVRGVYFRCPLIGRPNHHFVKYF